MKITITATVPDEWRDELHYSGVAETGWDEITGALSKAGDRIEDIDIQAEDED